MSGCYEHPRVVELIAVFAGNDREAAARLIHAEFEKLRREFNAAINDDRKAIIKQHARLKNLETIIMASLQDIQTKVTAAQTAVNDLATRSTGAVTPEELQPVADSLDALVDSIGKILPAPAPAPATPAPDAPPTA